MKKLVGKSLVFCAKSAISWVTYVIFKKIFINLRFKLDGISLEYTKENDLECAGEDRMSRALAAICSTILLKNASICNTNNNPLPLLVALHDL